MCTLVTQADKMFMFAQVKFQTMVFFSFATAYSVCGPLRRFGRRSRWLIQVNLFQIGLP